MSESHPRGGAAGASTTADGKEASVCPTCGRDDFKSELGMKMHHGRVHGESIGGVELECTNCGDTYREPKHRVSRSRFCSRECKDSWQSDGLVGENNPNYKERLQLECGWCGDSFERPQCHEGRAKYCSRACKDASQSENTGEDHPRWVGRVDRTCEMCGGAFEVNPNHAHPARFCSYDCRDTWRSENVRGEDHPSWKGGSVKYYGPNWFSQRRKARERDGHTCQDCGATESRDGRALEVHHITRMRWFKDNFDAPEWHEKGNALDNLVSLCNSCHYKWEGIPLRPDNR